MQGGNWQLKACMCSLIVALTIIETTMWADAYPTYQAQDDDMNNFKQCHSDSEIQTLCQRCAKSTKSRTVYPLCCNNTENILIWCQEYIGFGIQKPSRDE